MKSRWFVYILGMTLVCLLDSCGLTLTPEEKVSAAFEEFVTEMQHGNMREAVRTRCRGDMKKNYQMMLNIGVVTEKDRPFKKYQGIKKLEFLPDYSDVALVVVDGDDGKLCTYVMHAEISGDWNIYYLEGEDLTQIKHFIEDEDLVDVGIITVSDSEVGDCL
ncbi:MAG: hypothetical protein ACRCZY_01395 [Phocaeicola sp.]